MIYLKHYSELINPLPETDTEEAEDMNPFIHFGIFRCTCECCGSTNLMKWQICRRLCSLFSEGQSLYVITSQGRITNQRDYKPLHSTLNKEAKVKQGSSCFFVSGIKSHVRLHVAVTEPYE